MCYSCGYTPCACGSGNTTVYTMQPMATIEGVTIDEQSFVPVLTAGGTPATSIEVVGRYSRIGNLVHVLMEFDIATLGAMVGALVIDDLPFTAASYTDYAYLNFFVHTGVIVGAAKIPQVRIPEGSDQAQIRVFDQATGLSSSLSATALSSSCEFQIEGWYFTED